MRAARREAGAGLEFPGGLKRETICHFDSGRKKSVSENSLNRPSCRSHAAKARRESGASRRKRQKAQSRLRYDAKQSLRAHEKPDKVKAGLVLVCAASAPNDRTICQHNFKAKHVVPRHAILQTTRAPCVGCDVPADAAILEARRIRRIIEALFTRRRLQVACNHSRFDHRDKVRAVDLLDAIHSFHRQHDSASCRNGASHVPVAGTSRRHGQLVIRCHFHHRGDLCTVLRKRRKIRPAMREPFVPAEFLETAFLRDDSLVPELASQFFRGISRPGLRPAHCENNRTSGAYKKAASRLGRLLRNPRMSRCCQFSEGREEPRAGRSPSATDKLGDTARAEDWRNPEGVSVTCVGFSTVS